MKFLLIALLLLFGTLGCSNSKTGDLVGTWVISESSRRVLPAELQTASAKLVLNSDGTFVASSMPGLFYFPRQHAVRLENGRGVWKLVSREGKQQVQLDFQVITDWKDGLPFGTQLEVSRGSLYYFLGDPDEGRRVEFERK
jgi:hypothetical protein